MVSKYCRALFVVLAVHGFGCASEDPEVSDDDLTGGRDAPEETGVGGLLAPTAFGSGVLIAPDWVLTAGHVADNAPTTFYYGAPPKGKRPHYENLRAVAVDSDWRVPDSWRKRQPGAVDVGLVHLARKLTGVKIYPLGATRSDAWVGASCKFVGLGLDTKTNGYGVRKSARASVAAVEGSNALRVTFLGAHNEHGDSGGPLLCDGSVVSLNSMLYPGGALMTRVDATRKWITDELKRAR